MAHFALINEENIVQLVITVDNSVVTDSDTGLENEQLGIDFCKSLYGQDTQWIQTSYNNNFRLNYAGIGYIYDQNLDVFLFPKPYPSWVLDQTTYQWIPPIPHPNDDHLYEWNEETISWDMIPEPEGIPEKSMYDT